MDLGQLRCFLAAGDELHFGRAAQRLHMMPAALGRQIRLLEEHLGTRLFARTTRAVSLTDDGAALMRDAREVIVMVEEIESRFRSHRQPSRTRRFRIGAIDSAAAGLIPRLLHDIHAEHPELSIQLLEDKTVRLLPKLLSGALDLAFVRPPERPDKRLEFRPLLHESAVVAFPRRHWLANRKSVSLDELADQPLIVPDRRSRPHSHDLTVKLFREAGLSPDIAAVADEKQTIVNLVAAQLGAAIVPRWTSRLVVPNVRFVPLKILGKTQVGRLPLAAAWIRESRDLTRDMILAVLAARLPVYAFDA